MPVAPPPPSSGYDVPPAFTQVEVRRLRFRLKLLGVITTPSPDQQSCRSPSTVRTRFSLRNPPQTLIDLAGHRRYLKTTVSGLAGCYPDFAIVVINGNDGVKGMTAQHITICQSLRIPLVCVVTKVDMAPKVRSLRLLRLPGACSPPRDLVCCLGVCCLQSGSGTLRTA